MKLKPPEMEDPGLNVASLIDMTFLLLVYFMATASLIKSEADLGIRLPGIVKQAVSVDMPDEQIIEIANTGVVFLNGRQFGQTDSDDLSDLSYTLERYRASSEASGNKALITVSTADESKHQRIIDVLDACAGAGIENVTFASSK
ncbi:MAG: biopolymer transporter ExbD [Verrucomicrobiota bacterium]|nr:biopolymer transporter ExbD [Verrucomicrobiota bacterium]